MRKRLLEPGGSCAERAGFGLELERAREIPLADWLAGPWAEEVRTVFDDPSAALRALIPAARLAPWRSWQRHPDRARAARAVFTLLTVEHWLRRWG